MGWRMINVNTARVDLVYNLRNNMSRTVGFDPKLGNNGVVCAQCHPNAANSRPESYPNFQKQIGRVVTLPEMINWCIRNPLEGQPLPVDSPEMTALVAYATYERRGVKLEPGRH
jgi:cytochrome c